MPDAVNPSGIWTPFGAFSMAVIQGEGQIVRLKGQVSLDPSGQVVGAGDIRGEFFAPPFPVTTPVEVARPYHPDLVIEVTAVAEIPRQRFHRPTAEGPSTPGPARR